MPGKEKTREVRKNRFKKNARRQNRRWPGRLLLGLKLSALILLLLAASALFMAGYAAVTRSDYFRTQTIAVTGNQRLSEKQILSQANVRNGDNLLALNLRLVRERLLANPWIDDARVSREIPETIVIHIKEHVPLAQVDLGRKFLIDTRGRIFKEVKHGDIDSLPLVTGIAYADISLGRDDLSPTIATVVKVLTISQAQHSAIPYAQIQILHLDKEMGVSLTLKESHVKIKLGFDRYEDKYERFRQLRLQLERNDKWRDYQVVDLNNPDQVVVQFG